MASVYQATDERFNREVAVKVFRASTANQDDVDRQEYEMQLLAGLSHPGIVTVLDAGILLTKGKHPHKYLVMELVRGSDLRHKLAEGSLSPRQIAQIGSDLADGLEYLHQQSVVHRDIKPANILIVDDENEESRFRAKLTDFGISMPTEIVDVGSEEAGSVDVGSEEAGSVEVDHDESNDRHVALGTAAYLSPEHVMGQPVGPASDVYSLGLVLLECFTGVLAFPGEPEESALSRIDNNPVVPDDLTPEWRELLSGMTAFEVGDRPTIREVVLSLRQALTAESARHKAEVVPDSD